MGQQADKLRTAQAGFDHHLVKPIDPTVLPGLLLAAAQSRVRSGSGEPAYVDAEDPPSGA